METGAIIFDPLLPWTVLWGGVAFAMVFAGLAVWRGLTGWWVRGGAFAILLLAVLISSIALTARPTTSPPFSAV